MNANCRDGFIDLCMTRTKRFEFKLIYQKYTESSCSASPYPSSSEDAQYNMLPCDIPAIPVRDICRRYLIMHLCFRIYRDLSFFEKRLEYSYNTML